MTALLSAVHEWYCPNCGARAQTIEPRPHTEYHICPALRGLNAPLIPVGTKAKIVAHDRDDYVGTELVQTDAYGRPVMSITITRDEGQDAIVFAPAASGSFHR